MADERVSIFLIAAEGEPPLSDARRQKELSAFADAARDRGLALSSRIYVRDNAPEGMLGFGTALQLGEYMVPLATAGIASISTLVGVWLKGRSDRNVRIKVGDIEAEAATIEDVERLLRTAKDFRDADDGENQDGEGDPHG